MAALLFLWLVLAMGEVDGRGSARDTILATFNTALLNLYPESEERATILIDQVQAMKEHIAALECTKCPVGMLSSYVCMLNHNRISYMYTMIVNACLVTPWSAHDYRDSNIKFYM